MESQVRESEDDLRVRRESEDKEAQEGESAGPREEDSDVLRIVRERMLC